MDTNNDRSIVNGEKVLIINPKVVILIANAGGVLTIVGGFLLRSGKLPKTVPTVLLAVGLSSFLISLVIGWFGSEDENREGLGIFWNMITGNKPKWTV